MATWGVQQMLVKTWHILKTGSDLLQAPRTFHQAYRRVHNCFGCRRMTWWKSRFSTFCSNTSKVPTLAVFEDAVKNRTLSKPVQTCCNLHGRFIGSRGVCRTALVAAEWLGENHDFHDFRFSGGAFEEYWVFSKSFRSDVSTCGHGNRLDETSTHGRAS